MKNKEIIKDLSDCREELAEERPAARDEGDIKGDNMERDYHDYIIHVSYPLWAFGYIHLLLAFILKVIVI